MHRFLLIALFLLFLGLPLALFGWLMALHLVMTNNLQGMAGFAALAAYALLAGLALLSGCLLLARQQRNVKAWLGGGMLLLVLIGYVSYQLLVGTAPLSTPATPFQQAPQ